MAEKELQEKKPVTMVEYVDSILASVNKTMLTNAKTGMVFPKNYVPANALQSAILIIQKTVDKEKKLALSVCSPESVKQSLQQMLQDGLNPAKKQGYFIVFGNQLTWMPSYFGEVCKAKYADPNIKDVYGEIVFEKDKFAYQIKHGYKIITIHEQAPENVDLTKIKGAYATILYNDGTEASEYMNWQQIQNSWIRGQTKGQSDAHKLAPEEMCKRTVLRRLCKMVSNTSDDSELVKSQEEDRIDQEIDEKQNKTMIDVTPEEEEQEGVAPAGMNVDENGVIQDEPEKKSDPDEPDSFPE